MAEQTNLKYDSSIKKDKTGKAILGVLEGPCADFVNATRNGRVYSDELWERVFNDPIIKEQFECGGILGELDHPDGRDEIDTSKVAICMPEAPHKNDKGQLVARFDILDTPNGRIAKTLCDYGYKFGISSRGSGDVTEDINGNEVVDPETYDFKCFDLVLLPAVKSARLRVVEGLENKPSLKKVLQEALSKANPEEKKIMTDTLTNLNIDFSDDIAHDSVDNVKDNVVKELRESIKARQALEAENRKLQEKLSVCYAKETKIEEELQRYKSSVINLSDSAKKVKPLQVKVDSLEEALKAKADVIDKQNARIQKLTESLKNSESKQKTMNESFSSKQSLVEKLTREKENLNEQLSKQKAKFESEQSKLNESLENLRKDLSLKESEFKNKLDKATKIVENWKKVANDASDYYIKSRARALGVSSVEIKNKLEECFTFEDVDKVCDEIKDYQLNIGRLPFDLSRSKVTVRESKETLAPLRSNPDDEVDAQLMRVAQSFSKK